MRQTINHDVSSDAANGQLSITFLRTRSRQLKTGFCEEVQKETGAGRRGAGAAPPATAAAAFHLHCAAGRATRARAF